MMNYIEYIFFRLYECFSRKDKDSVIVNIAIFLLMIESSLFVLFVFWGGLIINMDFVHNFLGQHRENKLYTIIPISIILFIANYIPLKIKYKNGYFNALIAKYKKDKYELPMWVIFSIPVIIILVSIIGYGFVKGTVRFPLLESLFFS